MSMMTMPSAPPPSEMAMRGANRSRAHFRTSSGGSGSYMTDSSPASYSSRISMSLTGFLHSR